MFLTLMIVNFLLAASVAGIVAYVFNRPIRNIMNRIIDDTIAVAWARYMQFAIFVTGISAGVRIYELERYITPLMQQPNKPAEILVLTTERWILELYRTVIGTLQGITWMLLVFFVVSLLAYVIVRIAELRKTKVTDQVGRATLETREATQQVLHRPEPPPSHVVRENHIPVRPPTK